MRLFIPILLLPICSCLAFDNIFSPIGIALEDTFNALKCRIVECCNRHSVPADFTGCIFLHNFLIIFQYILGLENVLRERIYGQHLVNEAVVNALRSHWSSHKPQKALTLSFHGWPGGGKNYVSKFIIESMFKLGSKSSYVHNFIGRIHFPSSALVEQYQKDLHSWLRTNITRCSKQMFIFDEVDKMPPGVLNAIKPMIDYRDDVDGMDYRESVFIFLSNTGAQLINEHYLNLWKTEGRKREDVTLHDFERIITTGAFNEEGGFHQSDTIKSNLIDHYIPFLPMEKRHVKLCILDEFKQRNILDPRESHVE